MTWRHTVYGGVFSLAPVRGFLERVFGNDPQSLDARRPGESALYALTVTADGRPLLGSQELSGCAWALGRTVSPGPSAATWLEGFDDAVAGCSAALEDLVADDDDTAEWTDAGQKIGLPVGYDELAEFAGLVAERFGVVNLLEPGEIRVLSVPISVKAEFAENTTDFLNSFFAADLALVAGAVENGRYGAALDAYLRGGESPDANLRVDVRERLDAVYERVAPRLTPLGRWPKNPEHPLALSQQFAVNTALSELLKGAGLLAVNGPPGTGKTTMLRDLLAAVVTERARRLADLPTPSAAFEGHSGWKTGGYQRSVNLWRDHLTGFEMVVASANNGAVENVSLELPLSSEIDLSADYFAELADRVIRKDKDGRVRLGDDGKPAKGWGLVAARLGNKRNRQQFVSSFWFGDRETKERGLQDILREYENTGGGPGWPEAVKAFRRAEREVADLQKARTASYERIAELPRAEREQRDLSATLDSARERRADIRRQIDAAMRHVSASFEEMNGREAEREKHHRFKPGLLTALFTFGRAFRDWHAEDVLLMAAVKEAKGRQKAAANAVERLRGAERDVLAEGTRLERRLTALTDRIDNLRATLDAARTKWGEMLPGREWWTDEEFREKSAPWTDREWNEARTRLFLAALRLHQAFLAAQAERMTRNLRAAVDVLQGAVPYDAPEEAVLAAWQSLFFVVPLVSTTFASFDRVFPHLGQEALGWLFIDEAGQAAPQLAAGAIWRSRRAIVVGDPLQLEPVVSLPYTTQQALRRHHSVDETWLPSDTSVQRLADQSNRYGTYLPADDDRVWVGAPLRVHRRCDQPMFDVSNEVAYDGLMVYGVVRSSPFPDPRRTEPHHVPPPESKWIDVAATESDGHWVPAEGTALRLVLTQLRDACGIQPSQVFVITPFRDVADQIVRIAQEFKGLRGGTIHTAQGKEADVVVFVLGGDPRRPGAKAWAAQKPNLVNVAATRARHRLYVIGDHTAWSQQRYFKVLARELPRHDPVRREL
jgi:hypothetical protein